MKKSPQKVCPPLSISACFLGNYPPLKDRRQQAASGSNHAFSAGQSLAQMLLAKRAGSNNKPLRLLKRIAQSRLQQLLVLTLLPLSAVAMQPLDENQLANVTGQDGVNINLTLPGKTTFDMTLYDRDGIPASVFSDYVDDDGYPIAKTDTGAIAGAPGALIMNDIGIDVSQSSAPIKLVIDAGSTAQGAPVLNINVSLPEKAVIHLGDLKLASTSNATGQEWNVDGTSTLLLSNGGNGYDLQVGGSSVNIQLGNVAQLVKITPVIGSQNPNQAASQRSFFPIFLTDFTFKQGIHIEGLELKDAYKDGNGKQPNGVKIDNLYINDNVYDAGSDSYASLKTSETADLTIEGWGGSITDQGMAFAIGQLGDATGGINIQMNGNHLGGSTSLGNLYIQGLHMGDSVLTIAGH